MYYDDESQPIIIANVTIIIVQYVYSSPTGIPYIFKLIALLSSLIH